MMQALENEDERVNPRVGLVVTHTLGHGTDICLYIDCNETASQCT